MAYSGTSTIGTAYTPPAGQALPAGCGTSCASFPTPCPALPPCITYRCVTGATSSCVATCGTPSTQFTTRTCMAYSGTSTVGTAFTPPAGQALPAGCGTSCASFPTPCPTLPPCYVYRCERQAFGACSLTCSPNG